MATLVQILKRMSREQRAGFLLRFARRFGETMVRKSTGKWARIDGKAKYDKPDEEARETLGSIQGKYPDEW